MKLTIGVIIITNQDIRQKQFYFVILCENVTLCLFWCTGICGFDEFECDNGRCIDNSLKDNLDDNCGDLSDETYGIGVIIITNHSEFNASFLDSVV